MISTAWLYYLAVCAAVMISAMTLTVLFACWFVVDWMLNFRRRANRADDRDERRADLREEG